jgi:dethiobiotin synthetase
VSGFFITGTDTGVGKSVIATALVRGLVAEGLRVAVMKPVASGSQRTTEGLRNEDALALMAASNVPAPYDLVNPYCFEPPISPHIAAHDAGISVDLRHIRGSFEALASIADVTVVEGAGGWLAPIGPTASIQELALELDLPVILVVGMRLGCINHARLTKLAIETSGAGFAGWVANTIDPAMARSRENLETLIKLLGEPPLAVVPWQTQDSPPLALTAAAAQLLAAQ